MNSGIDLPTLPWVQGWILAPLKQEFQVVRRAIGRSLTTSPVLHSENLWVSEELGLFRSGIGAESMEAAQRELFRRSPPDWVLLCGFCGAINPDVKSGDVFIIRRALDPSSGETFRFHSDLIRRIKEVSGLEEATVATVRKPLLDPDHKRELHDRTGADLIDLETYPLVRSLRPRDVMLFSIRVVLDDVNRNLQPLDPLIRKGEPTALDTIEFLWEHPGELPLVVKTGWDLFRASRTLSRVLEDGILTDRNKWDNRAGSRDKTSRPSFLPPGREG